MIGRSAGVRFFQSRRWRIGQTDATMLLRLLVALLLLAPAAASGQSRSVMLTSCVPNGFSEVQAWRKAARQLNRQRLAALRQEEAGRMAGRDDVWRDHDRLYLALDDDKVAVLTDCPYPDDGMHLHSWLGFDETGRFHITLADSGDDQTYLLVSRREGMPMEALSLPLWAPDKKKFAVGGCNLRAGRTLLVIASPSGGALSPEGTIELPCTSAPNCRFDWEGDKSLLVACANLGPVITRLRVTQAGRVWTAGPVP